jgi:hypothetical protein
VVAVIATAMVALLILLAIIGLLSTPFAYWIGRTAELAQLIKGKLQLLNQPLAGSVTPPAFQRSNELAPRIGELRVTNRMLHLYRSFQEEVRAHGRYTVAAAELNSALQTVLRHLPWEDTDLHDLHFHQLHLLAFPDPKTRPKRRDVIAHNPLVAAYERERNAGTGIGTERLGKSGDRRGNRG